MSTRKKKPTRPKPRLPRGLADRGPGEIATSARMLATISEVYQRYGFEPVETPAIEFSDVLGKFLPDQDRPNEGVFSFRDDDGQWLSLRYDLTAPLARYVAENFATLPKPYRSYRAGWVFRNEKPGPGRFRQFMQFDADTVGAASPAADAEFCMMAADTLEALGIERGNYVIRVNNRKVLDGVMEAIGLAGEENAARRLIVLRAIDKLDRLGTEGVRLLLGEGRRDESGDFTKGAGLGDADIATIMELIEVARLEDSLRKGIDSGRLNDTERYILKRFGRESPFNERGKGEIPDDLPYENGDSPYEDNEKFNEGLRELGEIDRFVRCAGYEDRVRIDFSVVRGLEYYTGPVFEAELLFDVTNDKGQLVRFGSVGGGGRYDGLVGRFRGENVPATGFSLGVSRLAAALRALGRFDDIDGHGPVIVTVMDRDRICDYQRMAMSLRAAGIRAEMFLGNPKQFGKQLQYADRRNSPCVVIQGQDERARGVVQIKDLFEGKRLSARFEDNREWRKARAAQIEVPQEDLVEAVRGILDRYGGERDGRG